MMGLDIHMMLRDIHWISFQYQGRYGMPMSGEYIELSAANLDYLVREVLGSKDLKKSYMRYVYKKNYKNKHHRGWVKVIQKDYKGLTPAQIRSKVWNGEWKITFPYMVQIIEKKIRYSKGGTDVFLTVEFVDDYVPTFRGPASESQVDQVLEYVMEMYDTIHADTEE